MFAFFEIPETIDPTLRKVIYGLIYVHVFVFAVYLLLFIKSFFQKSEKDLNKFKKEAQGKLE
jgi:hypothetical protein